MPGRAILPVPSASGSRRKLSPAHIVPKFSVAGLLFCDQAMAQQVAEVASAPANDVDSHAEHRASAAAAETSPAAVVGRIPIERVMAIARERQVIDEYAIVFPMGERGVYSVITDRNRAFSRAYLHIDQYSGKVLANMRFKDFGRLGKFYTFGIIAHEGQLFGLANQLLGLIACLGVITLAVTGVMMWWSRRPKSGLGSPVSSRVFSFFHAAPSSLRWFCLHCFPSWPQLSFAC